MPTYEYVCKSCGHALEVFQSMTEAPKRKCPACGRSVLERQIGTGAAILFKGSGFYQTDYRSESYKKASEAETKPADAKSEGKSDGKHETEPKTKREAPKSEAPKATPGPEPKKTDAAAGRHKPRKPGADAA